MEFGERVKAVRTGAGLTQEQFASRLGVTRQAVSNWENGRNLPDIEVVIAMSQTFGVSLDELILGGEDMTRTTGEQNDMADKLIRDGSEGRWMRMSLAMSIVGAVLIVVAAVLAVVAENSVSYVDASGMLHEDFWLVPVSYACAAAGVLVVLANFVAQLRRREAPDGLVWASREVANPHAGASRDGARAFGSREGDSIFTKRQLRFLRYYVLRPHGRPSKQSQVKPAC